MRALLIAGLLLIAPAHAQRAAIDPALTPEKAQAAFETAVIDGCLASVSAGKRPAASAQMVESTDVETRRQIGAADGDKVWDVATAKGVVMVHERAERCVVTVYGPPAAMAVMAMGQKVAAKGFERMGGAPGLGQTLMGSMGGKRLSVTLKGSEPGMPGHQSRFSVTTATVFVIG